MLNIEVNVGPHLLEGFMHALYISMHNHNKNFAGVRNGLGRKWEESLLYALRRSSTLVQNVHLHVFHCKSIKISGIIHPKIKFLSLFTQICDISNPAFYDFLFNRICEEYPGHSFLTGSRKQQNYQIKTYALYDSMCQVLWSQKTSYIPLLTHTFEEVVA